MTPEDRSRLMATIKSRNTKPEVFVRHLLWHAGYRYGLKSRLPGHPDLYLRKYHTAIFVNGCFWHRHPGCKMATSPKSNVEFWTAKFTANTARDRRVHDELRNEHHVRVIVIWECTIRRAMRRTDTESASALLASLEDFLTNPDSTGDYLEL
ncbi:DNA mismatch endonuclease Vsr [Bifidobacterium sp. BRDM6]|uniref:Very short patch repair endonuclease n=2 Tax=Bifidobacterium choloepi TaxID=2614131 RepID=A0A6I5NMF6_9BIFI|nr:DNA mismatch endonuclease Vsr [Bifidobacterium choloepi]